MVDYNRDVLLKDLRGNVCEVFFTKVNGEKRAMRCTLREDLLPESYQQIQTEEKDFHQKNPNNLVVWDMQKNAWRSFRIENVEYVQVLDNY